MNKTVDITKLKVNQLNKLFHDALLNCYDFNTDVLDCSKSWSRQRSEKSFEEALNDCLCHYKKSHWTVIFRAKQFAFEFEHWEFGVSSMGGDTSDFIWISVRVELAEELFRKYKLSITEY